jgi:hypothetical protein
MAAPRGTCLLDAEQMTKTDLGHLIERLEDIAVGILPFSSTGSDAVLEANDVIMWLRTQVQSGDFSGGLR